MEKLAARLLGEALAAREQCGIERRLLCLIVVAECILVDSFRRVCASVAGLARLARRALEPPVLVPVVPVARPEVPAVERLLTLLAPGARLSSGQPVAECHRLEMSFEITLALR